MSTEKRSENSSFTRKPNTFGDSKNGSRRKADQLQWSEDFIDYNKKTSIGTHVKVQLQLFNIYYIDRLIDIL